MFASNRVERRRDQRVRNPRDPPDAEVRIVVAEDRRAHMKRLRPGDEDGQADGEEQSRRAPWTPTHHAAARALAPERQQVSIVCSSGNLRRPAELFADPRADRLARPASRWAGSAPGSTTTRIGTRARAQHHVEQMRELRRASRADVVGAAGRAPLQDQLIGANRVAHVGQIAQRFEVADLDFRRACGRLRSAAIRRANPDADERRILPRPEMIERPRDVHERPVRRLPPPTSSCASLLSPYGLAGTSGCCSVERLGRRRVDQRGARY